jgi:hypothetical protein
MSLKKFLQFQRVSIPKGEHSTNTNVVFLGYALNDKPRSYQSEIPPYVLRCPYYVRIHTVTRVNGDIVQGRYEVPVEDIELVKMPLQRIKRRILPIDTITFTKGDVE